MQVFPEQHHDHKSKVCEEGITDVNSQLSLMKEYKHVPLALTDSLKPAFHHLSEFLYQFCVLQRWIQLHYKQALCTVMQLSIWNTCKGAGALTRQTFEGNLEGWCGSLKSQKTHG